MPVRASYAMRMHSNFKTKPPQHQRVPHSLEEKMTRTLRARGQVLPLACVVLLVCALMMMASFSVANAVHERTRISSGR